MSAAGRFRPPQERLYLRNPELKPVANTRMDGGQKRALTQTIVNPGPVQFPAVNSIPVLKTPERNTRRDR
jgi:hypothetical protein